MPSKQPRRLGRPPSSSSVETRARIIDVAREAFAESGYGVTTNKMLATKAGITTGALYHYFDSKVDIYKAVYDEVQDFVFERFTDDLADATTLIERFEAMLESAHQLNREDPSVARFLGAARIDFGRHDELRALIGSRNNRGQTFFSQMIDAGIAAGEMEADNRDMGVLFMQIVTVGLTDAVSADPRRHRMAVDSIRSMVEGRLFAPPSPAAAKPKPKPKSKVAAATKR